MENLPNSPDHSVEEVIVAMGKLIDHKRQSPDNKTIEEGILYLETLYRYFNETLDNESSDEEVKIERYKAQIQESQMSPEFQRAYTDTEVAVLLKQAYHNGKLAGQETPTQEQKDWEQLGYMRGLYDASKVADLYAKEIFVLADDTILMDPIFTRKDLSEAGIELSDKLTLEGTYLAKQAHTAQFIAEAIRQKALDHKTENSLGI